MFDSWKQFKSGPYCCQIQSEVLLGDNTFVMITLLGNAIRMLVNSKSCFTLQVRLLLIKEQTFLQPDSSTKVGYFNKQLNLVNWHLLQVRVNGLPWYLWQILGSVSQSFFVTGIKLSSVDFLLYWWIKISEFKENCWSFVAADVKLSQHCSTDSAFCGGVCFRSS